MDNLLNMFCMEYMFSTILGSYLVIKGIDFINGDRVVPTWVKRIITLIVGATLFLVFKENTERSFESLLTSYFAAVFVYDGAIKQIITKLNIQYRKDD